MKLGFLALVKSKNKYLRDLHHPYADTFKIINQLI